MYFKNLTLFAFAVCVGLSISAESATSQQNPLPPIMVSDGVGLTEPKIVFVKERMHQVVPGDNLWNLSQDWYYNGHRWPDVVAQNPFLEEPGRIFYKSPDSIFVTVNPGEQLVTYENVQPTELQGPVSSLPIPDVEPVLKTSEADMNWLLWLLLFLALAGLALILYGRNWENSNPITSGPEQVPGGVEDNQVVSVLESRLGVRILSIEKGKLYGKGKPSYNFSPISLNRIVNNLFGKRFNGEIGYRAVVSLMGGPEQTVYCLKGCGNDVREGNYFTGLTFSPDSAQPKDFGVHGSTGTVSENKDMSAHSEEVKAKETQTDSKPLKQFDWKEKTLSILEGQVKKGEPVFFEFVGSDGERFRFDTTGKKPNEQKTPAQDKQKQS